MKRFLSSLVLVGLAVGAAACGSSESDSQPRTKNAAVTTTAAPAPASDIRLANSAGLIGYPFKLTASSAASPDAEFAFSTTTTGCRVDKYLNFLYYDLATQGTCLISVSKLPAAPLFANASATASTTTTVAPKVDATLSVTFYPQAIPDSLRNGLIGYWPFNSPSTLTWNAATNSTDLKVVGKPGFRQGGKFGGSLSLNGSSDYLAGIAASDSLPGLDATTKAYTMSMWMLPKQFSGGRGLMGWGAFGSGTAKTNAFRLKGDDNRVLGCNPGGLVNYWWAKDITWEPNNCQEFDRSRWVHVAVTYDGTTRKVFYNGQLKASDTPGTALAAANSNFRIGATATSNKEFFGGALDDAAVWSRALSDAEIQTLMRSSIGQNNSALPATFKPFVPVPCYEQGGFCEVGDITPDGGTVFYVGDFIDRLTNQPMKYLAFAPDDLRTQVNGPGTTPLKGYERLCGGKTHPIPEANQAGIGWGRRNTTFIASFCVTSAADKILNFSSGGVKDWFIPSERELNELCKYARGQRVGDTSVNCDKTNSIASIWAGDWGHYDYVSSTQGKIVNETIQLLAWAVGPLSDWIKVAVVIGQETGLLDKIPWDPNVSQGRVSIDFLTGAKYDGGGDSVQVRPVRAFGPGSQAPFVLASGSGMIGKAIKPVVSGGSGDGRVSYVVTDTGSAKCVLSADRASISATSVGTCKVAAIKAASDQYFRAVAPEQIITVNPGEQAPLSLPAANVEVGLPFRPAASGGTGTGSITYSIKDAGTAGCVFATGSVTDVVAPNLGTCVVRAVKAADSQYVASAPVDATFTVVKRKQPALTVNGTTGQIESEIALSTSGGGGAGAVTYVVTDPGKSGCAIVAGKAAVIAGTTGDCKVTASKAGDATFEPSTSAVGTVTVTNPVCGDSGKRADGSDCQIGDTGPGGGRVFHISSTPISYADGISTGGTILEVAAPGWNGSPNEAYGAWCRNSVGRAFGTAIGTGANNTFELSKSGCDPQSAVALSVNAIINGKDDWFLPSSKELNELCKFMRRQPVGDPAVQCSSAGSLRVPFGGIRANSSDPSYWASSEKDSAYGMQNSSINFGDGREWLVMETGGSAYFRPIRAFGAQKPPTTTSTSSTTSTTAPPAQQCNNTGKRPDGSACQVGDLGPAGGTIIAVSRTAVNAVAGVSAGGRYIEAAPADWTKYSMKDTAMPFGGCYDRTIGATATAVGAGAANTQKVAACDRFSIGQTTLDLIVANSYGSFDDWFIPSRDEAVGMAAQRVRLGLKKDSGVWTSSEIDEPSAAYRAAWGILMFDGTAVKAQKNYPSAVLRPVRAFG